MPPKGVPPPPPPMPGGGGPPPPPPPAPSFTPPPASSTRNNLLASIQKGAKLKSTVTNDRSAPAIVEDKGRGPGGARPPGGGPMLPPMMTMGLPGKASSAPPLRPPPPSASSLPKKPAAAPPIRPPPPSVSPAPAPAPPPAAKKPVMLPKSRPDAPAHIPVQPEQQYVRAIADYTAQDDTQMSFVADAVMVVISTHDGWFTASLNGARGLVPATYVERCDPPAPSPAPAPAPAPPAPSPVNLSRPASIVSPSNPPTTTKAPVPPPAKAKPALARPVSAISEGRNDSIPHTAKAASESSVADLREAIDQAKAALSRERARLDAAREACGQLEAKLRASQASVDDMRGEARRVSDALGKIALIARNLESSEA